MTNTSNYGLKKPDKTEFYDVNVQNDNMDAIDAKLKELEENASDTSTVRYVNDESDQNYGWVQYLDADGNWVNWVQSGATERYLFLAGDEYTKETGGFSVYNGSCTYANNGSALTIKQGPSSSDVSSAFIGTNREINLSNIGAIEVVFSASVPGSANSVSVGVASTKGGEFTAVKQYGYPSTSFTNEVAIIDVENVSSGYIQIKTQAGGLETNASIISIKLIPV